MKVYLSQWKMSMIKTFTLALIAACAKAACTDPIPSYNNG